MLTPEICGNFKSRQVIEVMRHLPYLSSEPAVNYKSHLIDYTTIDPKHFSTGDFREEDNEYWSSEREVDRADLLYIAWGYESGGIDMILLVQDGEILEDIVRVSMGSSTDVKDYFEELKEAYRSLKLIPRLGKLTIEAADVEERTDEISDEEVRSQTESWGTPLDVQYVRQVYRHHGWPNAFQKHDAWKLIDDLISSMEEDRGQWQDS